jgi:hypothetical protein
MKSVQSRALAGRLGRSTLPKNVGLVGAQIDAQPRSAFIIPSILALDPISQPRIAMRASASFFTASIAPRSTLRSLASIFNLTATFSSTEEIAGLETSALIASESRKFFVNGAISGTLKPSVLEWHAITAVFSPVCFAIASRSFTTVIPVMGTTLLIPRYEPSALIGSLRNTAKYGAASGRELASVKATQSGMRNPSKSGRAEPSSMSRDRTARVKDRPRSTAADRRDLRRGPPALWDPPRQVRTNHGGSPMVTPVSVAGRALSIGG